MEFSLQKYGPRANILRKKEDWNGHDRRSDQLKEIRLRQKSSWFMNPDFEHEP